MFPVWDCTFAPNGYYFATCGHDRTARLWDTVTGNCVRLMTGHKSTVLVISFSPDGRFIASGSSDRRVLVWDIAYGHLLAELSHHNNIISSLAFSREGTVLVSSAIDSTIAIWDFAKLTNEASLEDVNVTHNPDVIKDSE